MANKLQFSGQSGLTIYAVIRERDTNDIWDGSDFVVFVAIDYANYDVPLTEQGSSGFYDADVPAALPAGKYHITYQARAGATPNQTDEVVFQALFDWSGTEIVEELETGDISVTDICNMALSHLGIGKEIANIETDRSEEANACNRFYQIARNQILREFAWPFASKSVALSLVANDPTDEWAFSYRYPSDSLKIRRIFSGIRYDNHQSVVPYRIVRDDAGLLIYTDLEDPTIEYTVRETNPGKYTPDFILALSFLLAFYIAPRLTRGDPFKMGGRALEMYSYHLSLAKAGSGNEEGKEQEPEAESIRVRE